MLSVACLNWMIATTGSVAASVSAPAPRQWLAQTEETEATPEGVVRPPRPTPRDDIRDLIRRPGVVPRRTGAVEQTAPLPPPAGAQPTATQPPPSATPPRPAQQPGVPARPGVRPAPVTPAPAPGPAQQPAATPGTNGEGIDFEERARKGKFSFDFAKAEIVDIVKAISDMTRRNFIIPENLKGQRITILSPTKITAGEAYQVFLAALEVNGITIVRSGKFYKLLQAKDAIREPIPTCIGGEECPKYSEMMVTIILPIQHVDVQQLNGVVQSLKSKEGEVQVFQPTNALIISEYAHNLTRIRRIIESLDVPGFEDELQIVQIQYATATEISDKITQIFEVAGRGAAGVARPGRPTPPRPDGAAVPGVSSADEGEVQISKVVPDDRTNQLIIKANRRSFDAIRRLIARLDVPVTDAAGGGRVHVYYLENASAEDLASTLSSLAQGQPTRQARPSRAVGQPEANVPGQPARGGIPESATLFEGDVKVTADKSTNSLLIVASGRDFRALSRIIEQLDRPRRQVYVEAAILEVTVGNSLDFGLNYHTPASIAEGDLPFADNVVGGSVGFFQSAGGSDTLGAYYNAGQLLSVAGGSVAGIFGKAVSLDIGGGNSVDIPSFGVILKLLETSSNARILSTPHILTTDNEEATIEVGQKVPFLRGTSVPSVGTGASLGGVGGQQGSSLGSLNNYFSSVDRVDVSLKLTLTPQINERGKIRLEIDQQVEDIVGEVQASSTPTTANRAAKTVVVVDDQQTVVLGGLMRDRSTDSETKVPVLGDLPLLGWLFKSRSHKVEKVNLLLVLTPYIIRSADDFQTIFERKMREYEDFAAEYYGRRPGYRAHVDYSRKRGPLAAMVQTLRRERSRAENGGEGFDSETIIRPRDEGPAGTVPPATEDQAPVEGESPIEGEPAPEGTPRRRAPANPVAPEGIPLPPGRGGEAPAPAEPAAPEVGAPEPAPPPADTAPSGAPEVTPEPEQQE